MSGDVYCTEQQHRARRDAKEMGKISSPQRSPSHADKGNTQRTVSTFGYYSGNRLVDAERVRMVARARWVWRGGTGRTWVG
jgi:hypothetical protein